MKFFLALFETIHDLFCSIFFANSDETIKRKALKAIFTKLNALPHPPISKDRVIFADFARLIYRLYVEALPIKTIFEQTILCKDIRVSNKFHDLLLTSAFTEEQSKTFFSFSYAEREKALQREAASSLDVIQRNLNEQIKSFHVFQNEIATEEMIAMEETINNIYRLYDFCCFDFETFFMHFETLHAKPLAELVKEGIMPKFNDVQPDTIMKELLDLNFVISNLNIDSKLIDAIQLIHEKITTSAENKFLFVLRQISALKDILDKELPTGTVLDLIRFIKLDPYFEDTTSKTENSLISEFNERQQTKFNADSKKLLKLFQESKIEKLVQNTFGNRKFFTFSGYNETINAHLQAKTNLSFDWIRPMELLRSFTKQNFEPNMKILLKTLLVEGSFTDLAYQKNLGSTFYYCETLGDKFEEFERMFSNDEKCSLQSIENFLAEIDRGANFERQLEKITTEANERAKQLVQTAVQEYTLLYTYCNQILSESRKPNGDILSNIKNLFASAKVRPLIKNFENDTTLLGKFLEIMKNYAILVKSEISVL